MLVTTLETFLADLCTGEVEYCKAKYVRMTYTI